MPFTQFRPYLLSLLLLFGSICHSATTIDILVLYPPELANQDPSAKAVSMMNWANLALQNSGSDVTFNVVSVQQVNGLSRYDTSTETIYELQTNQHAKALRAQHQADVVTMLTTVMPYCGVGFVPQGTATSIPDYYIDFAYNIVATTCISSFAHEVGHNLSLSHSYAQGDTGGMYAWGRGHGVNGNFVTTMAYPSAYGNASKIQYFSTPALSTCNGLPCGKAINLTDGADAVSALAASAPIISQWSNSLDPSAQISNLAATQGTVTEKVNLNWDSHPDYQSYRIYRSTQLGVEGTLLSEVTMNSFIDNAPSSNTLYFYAIRGKKNDGSIGPLSDQALGYANVAPTSASVQLSTYSDRPSSRVTPTIADLNSTVQMGYITQYEDFKITVLTQPAQGIVSVVSDDRSKQNIPGITDWPYCDRLLYTPPSDASFIGSDSFTFRVTDKAGATVVGTGSISVDEATPVEIAFMGTEVGQGLYANPGKTGVIGRITNVQSQGSLTISIENTTDSSLSDSYFGVRQSSSRYIPGYDAPLWQVDDILIKARYPIVLDPSKVETIKVVSSPNKYVKAHLTAPDRVDDSGNFDIDLSVGTLTSQGIQYDESSMGSWTGFLGIIQSNGSVTQLTDEQPLINGKAIFSIDPTGQNLLRLVGVINSQSPVTGYSDSRESRRKYIAVTLNKPIPGTVSLLKNEGPAPLALSARLNIDYAYLSSFGSSSWEISLDQGSTWTDTGKTGTTFLYKFDAGDYWLRAKIVNKNSNAVSYTEPVSIYAYEKLALKIHGNTFSAPSVPVTLSAELKSGETLVQPQDIIYKWEVTNTDGVVNTYASENIQLDSQNDGRVKVKLSTRLASTRDINYNWTSQFYSVVFKSPSSPRIGISGPRRVEIGNQYTYTARVVPPWYGNSTLNVASQWIMPDGQIIPGGQVDWSPPQSLINQTTEIKFEAWVDGYKETTLATTSIKSHVWDYIWSDFALNTRLDYPSAPAKLRLEAVPLSSAFRLLMKEGDVNYEWQVSDPSIQTNIRSAVAELIVPSGSNFTVSVRIFDNRGNEQVLSQDFSIADTPAYDLTFSIYAGNRYWREPLPLTVRANMSNGHRKDAPETFRWFLDDELVVDQTSYYGRFLINSPGIHVIRFEMESRLGLFSSHEEEVTVVANQIPTCELSELIYSAAIDFRAICSDVDGYPKTYEWLVNGERIPLTSNRMLYPVTKPGSLVVTVRVTDDAGGTTEISKTIEY